MEQELEYDPKDDPYSDEYELPDQYFLIYQVINGKRCHCHRQVYDKVMDFDSMSELLCFLRKNEKKDFNPKSIIKGRTVTSFYDFPSDNNMERALQFVEAEIEAQKKD